MSNFNNLQRLPLRYPRYPTLFNSMIINRKIGYPALPFCGNRA